MLAIAPKETHYKGYRFRSRLEARWAVFFDSLGIAWEYEKEGFDLPSGSYLPDFWLPLPCDKYPNGGYWLEVKPVDASEVEKHKARELCELTMHATWIVWGLPGEHFIRGWHPANLDEYADGFLFGDVVAPWCRPSVAELLMFERFRIDWEKIPSAIVAAKSARFEYGENGGIR